jgi:hypothetical protein
MSEFDRLLEEALDRIRTQAQDFVAFEALLIGDNDEDLAAYAQERAGYRDMFNEAIDNLVALLFTSAEELRQEQAPSEGEYRKQYLENPPAPPLERGKEMISFDELGPDGVVHKVRNLNEWRRRAVEARETHVEHLRQNV